MKHARTRNRKQVHLVHDGRPNRKMRKLWRLPGPGSGGRGGRYDGHGHAGKHGAIIIEEWG